MIILQEDNIKKTNYQSSYPRSIHIELWVSFESSITVQSLVNNFVVDERAGRDSVAHSYG